MGETSFEKLTKLKIEILAWCFKS